MLRERVFKVNDVAPKDNISSNSKFCNLSAKDKLIDKIVMIKIFIKIFIKIKKILNTLFRQNLNIQNSTFSSI